MECTTAEGVQQIFEGCPEPVRAHLSRLRQLVKDAAIEEEVGKLDECLKWGQPSYVTVGGSTVRLGWRIEQGNEVALFFHCQSKLVDTFRELYPEELNFDGNRAIVFSVDEPLPEQNIKHCVSLALTYHSRKHLPLLGA